MSKGAREGPLSTGMNFRSLDAHAIAGDHHHGIRNRCAHDRFWNRIDDDDSSFLAIFVEGFRGQAFSGLGPLQIFVSYAHSLLPAWIEDRRGQVRAGGDV